MLPPVLLIDLRRVEAVALGGHQHRRWLFAGDDQHVRRIARLVRLLVGHDLHALLRRRRSTMDCRPAPTETRFLHLAILRRGGNDAHAELACIGNRELDLPLAAGVGLALRGSDEPRAPFRQFQRFISTRNAVCTGFLS